jgi:hypothetical protein
LYNSKKKLNQKERHGRAIPQKTLQKQKRGTRTKTSLKIGKSTQHFPSLNTWDYNIHIPKKDITIQPMIFKLPKD